MLRELSGLLIGGFKLMLIWDLYCLGQGEAALHTWTMVIWGNSVVVLIALTVPLGLLSAEWFSYERVQIIFSHT